VANRLVSFIRALMLEGPFGGQQTSISHIGARGGLLVADILASRGSLEPENLTSPL
jgi:hypothetical protein